MRTNYLYAVVMASLAISLSAPQVNAADATSGSTTSTTSSTTSTSTTTSTTGASTSASSSSSADAAYFKRIEGRYSDFAGSGENLQSLASGLRHGTAITLNGDGASSVTFTPPTRPMGYGNVSRALDFASRDLAAAGITDPTPEQIQTALMGGTVTGPNGQVTTMDGILQLRSEGMGWGQIAHQVGISPAANAHGQNATLKNSSTTELSGTSRVSPSGKVSGGVTTAAGKTVNAGGNTKANAGGRSGIVSASGSSASTSGLSTAAGGSLNGNAYGHAKSGIVSAGGTNAGYSGITTGSGASAAAGTHSALGGSGNGNAFGKGKN